MKRIIQLIALLLCQLVATAQSGETTYTLSFQSKPEGSCNMNYRIDGGKSQAYNNTDKPQVVAGQKVKLELQEAVGCVFDHLLSADTIMDSQREYVSSFGGYHPTTEFVMPAHDVSITAVNTFDPELPQHPGESGWDPETGALVVTSFTPGFLEEAINTAITDKNGKKTGEVRRLTVAGKATINDLSYIRNLKSLEYLDFSRTYDIDEVWSGTFTNTTTLKTVLLPASITEIGQMAFEGCAALESFTCFATTPPHLNFYDGKSPFNGCSTSLIVYVPAESLPLYAEADGWKDMELMPITQGVHALTVNMPAGANMQQYKDMFLELANTKTGQTRRYVLTNRTQYTFTNLIEGSQYNVYLKNAREATLGSILAIDIDKSDVLVTFASLEQPRGIMLRLVLPDGSPADEDAFTTTWTDAVGNFIANGNSINGQMDGARIIAHVKLGEALGTQYLQPADTLFSVGQSATLTITLAPLPQATFSGTVTTTDGMPLRDATVSATQRLNDLYPVTLATTTDAQGRWTLTAYDIPAEVTAQATGYVAETIVRNVNNYHHFSPDFQLRKLSGTTVNLELSYLPAIRPGEGSENNADYSGYQDLCYNVYDETHNKELSNIQQQGGRLVLQDQELAEGTRLRVTATSPKGDITPATATCTVGADGTATATLPLVQLGQLKATFSQTDNRAVVGMLYDADGQLLSRGHYTTANATPAEGEIAAPTLWIGSLPDGQYTLVTMGESTLFNGVNSLASLTDMGLEESRDYLSNRVEIVAGRIDSLHNQTVPMMDESLFYWTTENTHFTANKSSLTVGGYVTLRTEVDFKSGFDTKDIQLHYDLPEGCQLVEGTVMAGNQLAQYALEGQRLTVPLTNRSDIVRFCVMPTEGGYYEPSASIRFDTGWNDITQPLGSVAFYAETLTISVPERVSNGRVQVSGTAIAASDVKIFEGDQLIGHTEAGPDGSWSMRCSLNRPYNLSLHYVHAEITTPDGITLQTEKQTVTVSHGTVTPVVYATNSGTTGIIKWDFRDYTVTPKHNAWPLGPGILPFTFKVDFYNEDNRMVNDTTLISNVTLYVLLSNDTYVELKAPYNASLHKWVAQADFSIDASPKNIFVDFLQDETILTDRQEMDDMQNETLQTIAEHQQMVKDVYAVLNEEIVLEDQALYDELDQLFAIENPDVDTQARIKELLDLLTADADPSQTPTLTPEEIEKDLASLDVAKLQWRGDMLDMLSLVISTDTIPLNTEEKEEQFDIPLSNGVIHFTSKKESSVNEQALLSVGYTQTPMTDGTIIYHLNTGVKEAYLDTRSLMHYILEWEEGAQARQESRQQGRFRGALVVDSLFDEAEVSHLKEIGSQLLDIGNTQQSSYRLAQLFLNQGRTLSKDLYTSANKLYEDGLEAMKRQMEEMYKQLLDSCETGWNKADDCYTAAKGERDIAAADGKGWNYVKFDLVTVTAAQKTISACNSLMQDAKKKKAFYEKMKETTKKDYRKVRDILSRMPSSLENTSWGSNWLAGDNALTDWARIYEDSPVGLLYSLRLCYYYAKSAYEDLGEWQKTYNAIRQKIPCLGNEDEAIALMTETVDAIATNGREETKGGFHHAARFYYSDGWASQGISPRYQPTDSLSLSWFYTSWNKYHTYTDNMLDPAFWTNTCMMTFYNFDSEKKQFNNSKSQRKSLDRRINDLKCQKPDPEPEPTPVDTQSGKPVTPTNPDGTPSGGGFRIQWSPFFSIDFYHDPSGFVYEAVSSNRLEGVRATCYYKETKEDMYGDLHDNIVLWNAEEYAQENPLFTDAEGMYRWDVPQGLWQVKYEKEGYETTYSEWLPVPPPQLEVNIGMTQLRQPAVQHVKACTDGIDITFDKYMRPKTLNTANILMTKNGQAIGGKIELLNTDSGYETPDSAYASKARFVPATPLTLTNKVRLTVRRQVESYAGLQMEQDFTQEFDVEQRITAIVADSLLYMAEGDSQTLTVRVLPAEAAKGKQLKAVSLNEDVVIIGNTSPTVTLDENGSATLDVFAASLGSSTIKLCLTDDEDLQATTLVIVKDPANMFVYMPKASRMSGTEIYRGAEIKLTCQTAGATILYTLDGSCPCDPQSGSVLTYEAPIVATGTELVIRAMAVANGMAESDVAEFRYKVIDNIVFVEPVVQLPHPQLNKETYYRIDGRQTDKLQRGFNIVRRTDGTTLKIVVK